jgi:hypothetical protein
MAPQTPRLRQYRRQAIRPVPLSRSDGPGGAPDAFDGAGSQESDDWGQEYDTVEMGPGCGWELCTSTIAAVVAWEGLGEGWRLAADETEETK